VLTTVFSGATFRRLAPAGVLALLVGAALTAPGASAQTSRTVGGCTVVRASSPKGPVKLVGPPVPELAVKGLSSQRVRFSWWFRSWPRECRPVVLTLGVLSPDATETTYIQKVVISAPSGVHVMVLPSFLHRGKIAVVAAYTRNQVSTPTMRVQIRD